MFMIGLFLKNRLPPISTPPDTLFPYTPRFRSAAAPDRLRPAARAASRIPRAGSVSAPARARSRPDLLRCAGRGIASGTGRSEEHTSELQSLMRISYAVFCLTKKRSPKCVNHSNYIDEHV